MLPLAENNVGLDAERRQRRNKTGTFSKGTALHDVENLHDPHSGRFRAIDERLQAIDECRDHLVPIEGSMSEGFLDIVTSKAVSEADIFLSKVRL
jgi:hypothetical protein